MSNIDLLPSGLRSSSIAQALGPLADIYDRVSAAQRVWMDATPYRCPDACGSCCEGFEPELLDVEAWFLAAWILKNQPELLSRLERKRQTGACAFADPDTSFHCVVYGGRPLICRLFAFSGDRDKNGRPRFIPCKKMEVAGKRQLNEQELLARYQLIPPLMDCFSREAEALVPGDKRRPLREAVKTAEGKLRYLMELYTDHATIEFPQNKGDNDNPDGTNPPLPRAG